jgi:hypothetical protein
MRCKILHLPTATVLYRLKQDNKINDINPNKYRRLYTYYELEHNINGYNLSNGSYFFLSYLDAERYLSAWSIADYNRSPLIFGDSSAEFTIYKLVREQCEIIKFARHY